MCVRVCMLCSYQECELIDSYCTAGDVDTVFSTVKQRGARKISFKEFEDALALVGESMDCVLAQLLWLQCVRRPTDCTCADSGRDRLTAVTV